MVNDHPLERYRTYLEAFECFGPGHGLDYGEAKELLRARDKLADLQLMPEEQRELARLDDLLIKHWEAVATDLFHPFLDQPRERWWWHIAEGPQARDRALKAS